MRFRMKSAVVVIMSIALLTIAGTVTSAASPSGTSGNFLTDVGERSGGLDVVADLSCSAGEDDCAVTTIAGGEFDFASAMLGKRPSEAPDSLVATPLTTLAQSVGDARIRGTVSYFSPTAGAMRPALGVLVVLYRLDDSEEVFDRVATRRLTEAAPDFSFSSLAAGTYALYVRASQATIDDALLDAQYWNGARYWGDRTDLVLDDGEQLDLGDIILSEWTLDVARLSGEDRFDVGVSVSNAMFSPGSVPAEGVPVIYIANGLNFPDALSAGPAAALRGGLVLLVRPDRIPAAVADELARLRPQRIVVAGGPASVSPNVFAQLQTYVADPSHVERAGGIDRYEASRNIVWDAFGAAGSNRAILATGGNFPDALSAGPAAASVSAPVILVNGAGSSVDQATRQLLIDLGVRTVYIAGGGASVSYGLEASLHDLVGAGQIYRLDGEDRFEVSARISWTFFESVDLVFVATGSTFPDALSGTPLAAATGSPLMLAPTACLPYSVALEILDLDAQALVLLGGPASLNPAIEEFKLC